MHRFWKLFHVMLMATISSSLWLATAEARAAKQKEIYPVSLVLADKTHEITYPSIAGNSLVFTTRTHQGENVFRVVKSSASQPDIEGESVPTALVHEAIRYGVAINDGGVGYVSNRIGPISPWLWTTRGDMHISLNGLAYRGNLVPSHLNATADGRFWCFDASMEKVRHNMMLQEFTKPLHFELRGQTWRFYDSNFYRFRAGYRQNAVGTENDFDHPFLYVVDRNINQVSMIPNAFSGAISPDGSRVVFTREEGGNYDLWMQNMDGSDLTQLTNTPAGEYEAAFSPDGSKLAYISNNDSNGNVRQTSVYMMELSSGKSTRLTFNAKVSDGGPAWKDEHTVVFHSNRAEKGDRTVNDWNLWQVTF